MMRRGVVKKLEAAGYRLVRVGDHAIFQKKDGRPVQVPNHRELNEETAKAILKAAGLK